MDKFLEKILKITSIGESVQIVALHGMGKSRFARQLVERTSDECAFYHIDTNQLPDFSFISFLNYLRILVGEKPGTSDATTLSVETTRLISQLARQKLLAFIFDYLDDLLIDNNKNVFKFLKVMRDQAKYRISYIFMVKNPIKPDKRNILGDLYELASEHVEYLPLMSDLELRDQVVKSYGPNVSFIPNKEQIEEIKRLSGKIPAFIKISMQAMRDQSPLNIHENHRLRGQLEEMVATLTQEELRKLSEIARGEIRGDYITKNLQNLGLLDTRGRIMSSLFQDFILETGGSELTASETLLLELLEEYKGEVVTKDKICEKVYPDVKNVKGISDHAIDQMVHRLRSKVLGKYEISTLRGRGYILSNK